MKRLVAFRGSFIEELNNKRVSPERGYGIPTLWTTLFTTRPTTIPQVKTSLRMSMAVIRICLIDQKGIAILRDAKAGEMEQAAKGPSGRRTAADTKSKRTIPSQSSLNHSRVQMAWSRGSGALVKSESEMNPKMRTRREAALNWEWKMYHGNGVAGRRMRAIRRESVE